MNIVSVFIGGGLGALSRYLSIQCVNHAVKIDFPLGTLLVNVLGSLFIGFLYKTFEIHIVPAELRLFLITGFLGGYTTFSSYSLETVQCIMNGSYRQAVLNILISNAACMVFVIIGIAISKAITGDL